MTASVEFSNILRICGCAVLSCVILLVIRTLDRTSLSSAVSVTVGAVFALAAVTASVPVVGALRDICARLPDVPYTALLFRAAAIGMTVQLTADTVRDCGEERIAGYVEWTGRVILLTLGLPLYRDLFDLAGRLLCI